MGFGKSLKKLAGAMGLIGKKSGAAEPDGAAMAKGAMSKAAAEGAAEGAQGATGAPQRRGFGSILGRAMGREAPGNSKMKAGGKVKTYASGGAVRGYGKARGGKACKMT
jgi:hypothetical protein